VSHCWLCGRVAVLLYYNEQLGMIAIGQVRWVQVMLLPNSYSCGPDVLDYVVIELVLLMVELSDWSSVCHIMSKHP